MEKITVEEFDLTHCAEHLSPEAFDLLAQRALDLTEELCFGRAERKEEEARRAMKEMISYWILAEKDRKNGVQKMTVGNFSVTPLREEPLTVRGVPVSPVALLILQKAGLRECSV